MFKTTNEICAALRITRKTLHCLRQQGLPAMKVGGQYRFDQEEVMDFIRKASDKNASHGRPIE